MLFEAAAEVGAVLAGASPQQRAQAAAYGQHIGMAFQLIDDVLDYDGDAATLGKNVGDDLREGKPTLPLIRVLEVGSDADKALIRRAIETGEADFAAVAAAIRATDALQDARAVAEAQADAARAAIAHWQPSVVQQNLLHFSSFAVGRAY